MLIPRVIPVLLMDETGLVKGENFDNRKYVGDPVNAVRIFNEKEADELTLIDVSITSRGLGLNYSLIEEIASEAFMPVAYGGGITSAHQAEKLFRLGVEKVIVNTAFFEKRDLITDCVNIAGSQSVIVSVDVRKTLLGRYEVVTHNGAKKTGCDPVNYATSAQDCGAGEILLTSVDREGTGKGLDIELIKRVTSVLDVPVVAHGGVGCLDHIKQGVSLGHASAVAVGSFFTFHGKHRAVLLTYPGYDEFQKLFSEDSFYD